MGRENNPDILIACENYKAITRRSSLEDLCSVYQLCPVPPICVWISGSEAETVPLPFCVWLPWHFPPRKLLFPKWTRNLPTFFPSSNLSDVKICSQMHTDTFRLFQPRVCAAVRSVYLSVRDYLQPAPMHALYRQMEIRSCTGERVRELHWEVQLALTETTVLYPDSYKTTLDVWHDASSFGQLTGSVPVLVSLSSPG